MTALLALLLASGLASAAEFTSVAGLESRLRALNRSVAEPILVGAAGADAEKVLARLQRSSAALPMQVVRVPIMGDIDAEMNRALAASGLRCALRVGTTDSSNLSVETYGDCRSAAEAAAGPPVPPPAAPAAAAPPVTPTPVVAPAPTAAAAAAPQVPPATSSLDRSDLVYTARSWAKTPDPTVALLESAIVGFGAGHFYADHPKQGATHLGLQVGGLAVVGLGSLISANARRQSGLNTGAFFTVLGSVTFTVDRFADIYTAPLSAREERVRMLGGR